MSESWQKHLVAASGYLELGMVNEAALEIEEISPEEKMRIEVLALRVEIYRKAGRWEAMETVATYLGKVQPDEPGWILSRAWVVRRARSLSDAQTILEEALERFPDCALLHYNLGCYASQLGDQEKARLRVERAISLDASFRLIALEDPDLEPLWRGLGNGSEK